MVGLFLAACAGGGVYLLWYRPAHPAGPAVQGGWRAWRASWLWMLRAALGPLTAAGQSPRDAMAASSAAGVAGAVLGFALTAAVLPAAVFGLAGAYVPVTVARSRQRAMRQAAHEAWPRLIAEVRLRMSHGGRSVPQALLEAGRAAPEPLRGACAAAEREWLLSTDLDRMFEVLKARVADPTADAACETLLVAHQVGGAEVDRRLAALVEDRAMDVQSRKDLVSRQAGARFARRFVLLVPLGMAVAGLSIGTGRDAYGTAWGQVLVVLGVAVVAACWWWSGRLMQLPEEQRVFAAEASPGGGGARGR